MHNSMLNCGLMILVCHWVCVCMCVRCMCVYCVCDRSDVVEFRCQCRCIRAIDCLGRLASSTYIRPVYVSSWTLNCATLLLGHTQSSLPNFSTYGCDRHARMNADLYSRSKSSAWNEPRSDLVLESPLC